MKNQILELNLGSIEKFGVFGDRIAFFQSNCAKLGIKSKTMVKLGIKLHKSKTKGQSEKSTQVSTL